MFLQILSQFIDKVEQVRSVFHIFTIAKEVCEHFNKILWTMETSHLSVFVHLLIKHVNVWSSGFISHRIRAGIIYDWSCKYNKKGWTGTLCVYFKYCKLLKPFLYIISPKLWIIEFYHCCKIKGCPQHRWKTLWKRGVLAYTLCFQLCNFSILRQMWTECAIIGPYLNLHCLIDRFVNET